MRINREEAMEGVREGLVDMVTEVLEVMGGPGVMVTEVPEVMKDLEVMEGRVENTEAEREENMEVANMDL